jgi:hypothetical protein
MRPAVTVAQLAAIVAATDSEAVAAVERLLWPAGPVCVKCGGVNNAYRISRPTSEWAAVYRCADRNCRASFSTKMGTIFQGATNLTWSQIIRMCQACLGPQPSLGKLALAGGITARVAARWWHSIPSAIKRGTIWNEPMLELLLERGAAELRTVRREKAAHLEANKERLAAAAAAKREARVVGLKCKCGGEEFWTLHAESIAKRRPTFRCKACQRDITYRGQQVSFSAPPAPPAPPARKRDTFYWDEMRPNKKKAGRPKKAAALTREQVKKIDKIDADAEIAKDQVANPDDYFPPEEAARRFAALLKAARFTKPVTQERLAEMNRSGELPRIEEMTTEQMEAVADTKEEAARSRMTPEQRAAIDAYKGEVKVVPTKGDGRRGKRPLSEKAQKSLEAVVLCTTLGFSAKEAAAKIPGASEHLVEQELQRMRSAGESMGLASEAKYRGWSKRRSRGRNKGDK